MYNKYFNFNQLFLHYLILNLGHYFHILHDMRGSTGRDSLYSQKLLDLVDIKTSMKFPNNV